MYLHIYRLVIRIRCDADSARNPLGVKFGCDSIDEAPRLLELASELGLDVSNTTSCLQCPKGLAEAYMIHIIFTNGTLQTYLQSATKMISELIKTEQTSYNLRMEPRNTR